MSALSPVLVDAFRLLTQNLYEHLEGADNLAKQDGEWSADEVTSACKLIEDLVLVLSELVAEHDLQPSGRCRVCASAWPCPVVTSIHAFVKDPQRQFIAVRERAWDEAHCSCRYPA